jgi:hypothetical protein
MELVVKIYGDKPSRIGVKYIYDYQAQRAYEDLVRRSGSGPHALTLEPVRERLTMVLTSKESGIKTIYKELEFKMEQINRLRQYFSPSNPLVFVHVFPKNNTLMVAKPFRKETFLLVTNFELINV